MMKVINGKKYDTETAEFCAEYWNGLSTRDFEYYKEELYRKRTGEYFLCGYGGGNSKYGEWHGNSGGPGDKIIPMSLLEAQKWGEENLDGEEYEEIFGAIDEGDKIQISTWISARVKEDLDALKVAKNCTSADIFIAGIEAMKNK